MRKIVFCIVWVLGVANLQSQTDTTFYFENNRIEVKKQDGDLKVQVVNNETDSAENLLFEGSYGEGFSSEASFNFTFAKLQKRDASRKLDAHWGGISWGFSSLASRDLNIANVENAVLKYSSYELGFNFGNFVVPMSKKHRVMFFTGIGLRFHRFNADNNTAFRIVDNYVRQVPAPEDIFYKTSKLTAWYITVPAMIECQKKVGKSSFYVQFGLEGGLRFFSASKVKYFEDGKKTKDKIGNKMNMNPVTVDAKVLLGYGAIGVYARYGLVSLFRAGRGTVVVPVSVGIQLSMSVKVKPKKNTYGGSVKATEVDIRL